MPTTHTEPQTARRVAHPAGAALARRVVDVCMACHSERWVSLFLCQRRPAAPSDLHGCDPNPVDKFDVRPKPTSSKTRAMAAKETHIATLQDARSSCYFGCDMHGEERRSRLSLKILPFVPFYKEEVHQGDSPNALRAPSGLLHAGSVFLPTAGGYATAAASRWLGTG